MSTESGFFDGGCTCRSDRVQLLKGEVEIIKTPSQSGKGQKISRCPRCHIAVWSNYAGSGEAIRFVRVGTLDEPDRFPPDTPAVREYYKPSERWPTESLRRRAALRSWSPR